MKKEEWIKIIEDLDNLTDEEKFHLLDAVEKDSLTGDQRDLISKKAKEQDEIDKKELGKLDVELSELRREEKKYKGIEKEMIDKLVYVEEQQSDDKYESIKSKLDQAYRKDYEAMEKEIAGLEKDADKFEKQVNDAIEKDRLEEAREKLK